MNHNEIAALAQAVAQSQTAVLQTLHERARQILRGGRIAHATRNAVTCFRDLTRAELNRRTPVVSAPHAGITFYAGGERVVIEGVAGGKVKP